MFQQEFSGFLRDLKLLFTSPLGSRMNLSHLLDEQCIILCVMKLSSLKYMWTWLMRRNAAGKPSRWLECAGTE